MCFIKQSDVALWRNKYESQNFSSFWFVHDFSESCPSNLSSSRLIFLLDHSQGKQSVYKFGDEDNETTNVVIKTVQIDISNTIRQGYIWSPSWYTGPIVALSSSHLAIRAYMDWNRKKIHVLKTVCKSWNHPIVVNTTWHYKIYADQILNIGERYLAPLFHT